MHVQYIEIKLYQLAAHINSKSMSKVVLGQRNRCSEACQDVVYVLFHSLMGSNHIQKTRV